MPASYSSGRARSPVGGYSSRDGQRSAPGGPVPLLPNYYKDRERDRQEASR